jgi:hypothetical protein
VGLRRLATAPGPRTTSRRWSAGSPLRGASVGARPRSDPVLHSLTDASEEARPGT